ncbi:MAG: hypothetical protein HY748_13615 [Elusimicrobia bacterium]|nr:hypothetical protein [Elusimicrobiota bacterium]
MRGGWTRFLCLALFCAAFSALAVHARVEAGGGAGVGMEAGGVGMEASGVSPWAALSDRWGLDLRDEQNRPVSRSRLERDLKLAAAQASADGSYASKLPHARAATLLMELLPAVDSWLRNLLPSRSSASASAAVVPKPPRIMLVALAAAFLALSSVVARRSQPRTVGSASKAPAVLRC